MCGNLLLSPRGSELPHTAKAKYSFPSRPEAGCGKFSVLEPNRAFFPPADFGSQPGSVSYPRAEPRSRSPPVLLLQIFPFETILQRRTGAAHRDRDCQYQGLRRRSSMCAENWKALRAAGESVNRRCEAEPAGCTRPMLHGKPPTNYDDFRINCQAPSPLTSMHRSKTAPALHQDRTIEQLQSQSAMCRIKGQRPRSIDSGDCSNNLHPRWQTPSTGSSAPGSKTLTSL